MLKHINNIFHHQSENNLHKSHLHDQISVNRKYYLQTEANSNNDLFNTEHSYGKNTKNTSITERKTSRTLLHLQKTNIDFKSFLNTTRTSPKNTDFSMYNSLKLAIKQKPAQKKLIQPKIQLQSSPSAPYLLQVPFSNFQTSKSQQNLLQKQGNIQSVSILSPKENQKQQKKANKGKVFCSLGQSKQNQKINKNKVENQNLKVEKSKEKKNSFQIKKSPKYIALNLKQQQNNAEKRDIQFTSHRDFKKLSELLNPQQPNKNKNHKSQDQKQEIYQKKLLKKQQPSQQQKEQQRQYIPLQKQQQQQQKQNQQQQVSKGTKIINLSEIPQLQQEFEKEQKSLIKILDKFEKSQVKNENCKKNIEKMPLQNQNIKQVEINKIINKRNKSKDSSVALKDNKQRNFVTRQISPDFESQQQKNPQNQRYYLKEKRQNPILKLRVKNERLMLTEMNSQQIIDDYQIQNLSKCSDLEKENVVVNSKEKKGRTIVYSKKIGNQQEGINIEKKRQSIRSKKAKLNLETVNTYKKYSYIIDDDSSL